MRAGDQRKPSSGAIQKHQRDQRHDAKRRIEQPWRRFYKTSTWQTLRSIQLRAQPLCERCMKRGRITSATTVNHVIPHKGDWTLFVAGPFESLCKRCHDDDVQGEEARGYSDEIGIDGTPIDPKHPFNR